MRGTLPLSISYGSVILAKDASFMLIRNTRSPGESRGDAGFSSRQCRNVYVERCLPSLSIRRQQGKEAISDLSGTLSSPRVTLREGLPSACCPYQVSFLGSHATLPVVCSLSASHSLSTVTRPRMPPQRNVGPIVRRLRTLLRIETKQPLSRRTLDTGHQRLVEYLTINLTF